MLNYMKCLFILHWPNYILLSSCNLYFLSTVFSNFKALKNFLGLDDVFFSGQTTALWFIIGAWFTELTSSASVSVSWPFYALTYLIFTLSHQHISVNIKQSKKPYRGGLRWGGGWPRGGTVAGMNDRGGGGRESEGDFREQHSNERDIKPLKNAVLNICFSLKNPSLLCLLSIPNQMERFRFALEQSDKKIIYKWSWMGSRYRTHEYNIFLNKTE